VFENTKRVIRISKSKKDRQYNDNKNKKDKRTNNDLQQANKSTKARSLLRLPLVEQEELTLLQHLTSPSVFSGVRVVQSLVFCVACCRSLFVLLSFLFLLSLYCLSFFDLLILITLLVFSNTSCILL
jgi:hypothetical protein